MFALFIASVTVPQIASFLELATLDVPQLLLVALLVVLTNSLL